MPDKKTGDRAGKPGIAIGPGLYHFLNMDGDVATRFHLRVDPDGGGILMANAAEAAHLSPVGVLMAHGSLEGLDEAAITAEVRANFHGATGDVIKQDLMRVQGLIEELASPAASYPVTNVGGADLTPEARELGAPFRADLVQGAPEVGTKIMQKLWAASIPHVTLLAQPGEDPAGLARLVEYTEDIGMIAGVRGVASWLDEATLKDIAFAGLDYLTVPFASCDPAEHDLMVGAQGDQAAAMRAWELCHEWELCPVAQVPLTDESCDELEEIIECIVEHNVSDLWFFAVACLDGEEQADAAGALPARALPQAATVVNEAADEYNARFIWQPPVKFDLGKTLPEHVIAGPRASGDVAIRVDADGTVYPARGKKQPAGNILTQEWSEIWESECFKRFREKVEAPQRSAAGEELVICGAGAPEDPTGWSDDSQEGDV